MLSGDRHRDPAVQCATEVAAVLVTEPASLLLQGRVIQDRVVAYSSMSRRLPPISWWPRSRPSRW
jgi:hypothetical protein